MLEPDEVKVYVCAHCDGANTSDEDMVTTSRGDSVCCDCALTCEHCYYVGIADIERFSAVNDALWCESCTENNAFYCESCNEYSRYGTTYIEDRSESWCESCSEDCYFCGTCEQTFADGCDECSEEPSGIHDYQYRPDPIFHLSENEESRLFFGIEVEVEAPYGNWDKRTEAANYAYRLEELDLAYLKGDGSLSCGFEVVTHPMTHAFYQNDADELWKTFEALRTVHKVKSWDTHTCGLHIHISRAGFSGGSHQHRFLSLVYSNKELYESLAGRSDSRWSSFSDAEHVAKRTDPNVAGRIYNSFKTKLERPDYSERYSAINTKNQNTLEMRIFRGSVKTDTIKAQISLAHASVEYTRSLSVRDIIDGALKADRFVGYLVQNSETYPELLVRMNKLNLLSTNQTYDNHTEQE